MVHLSTATAPADLETIRTLFREYADSLGVNLEYQGFEEELRDLPGPYGPPAGALLLARSGDEVIGCVGVRALDPAIAEMKRLFVRPEGRGTGAGRMLVEAAIRFATAQGYERMRLDTLPQMQRAQELYQSMGFMPIEAYRFSPVPGTVFLELVLTTG
jgi:GNAT superfamily N-acetyltransferase